MIKLELTQEQADRWFAHQNYVQSISKCSSWKRITPDKANKVLKLYEICGSKGKVARDLQVSKNTIGKILAAQGVPA